MQGHPTDGHEYGYEAVASFYDHDVSPLHWVITKGARIVALRLRADYNPKIYDNPAEVWVGADSPTSSWGNTLANDTVEAPLFVKNNGQNYKYLGIYEIMTKDASTSELAEARSTVSRVHDRGVSRIVFLKKK